MLTEYQAMRTKNFDYFANTLSGAGKTRKKMKNVHNFLKSGSFFLNFFVVVSGSISNIMCEFEEILVGRRFSEILGGHG